MSVLTHSERHVQTAHSALRLAMSRCSQQPLTASEAGRHNGQFQG